MRRKESAFIIAQALIVAGVLGLVILPVEYHGSFQTNESSTTTPLSGVQTSGDGDQSCSGQNTSSQTGHEGLNITIAKSPVLNEFKAYNNDTPSLGGSGGLGWEDLPVLVRSNISTSVLLTASSTPSGLWLKFIPSCLQVGPAGANATLLMGPATTDPGYAGNYTTVSIFANSSDNQSAQTTMSVHQFQRLAVLQAPGPFIQNESAPEVPSAQTYDGYDASKLLGVVYNPQSAGANETLSVKITVLGLIQNGSLVPIPSWMEVYLPGPFVLNTTVPYYFDAYVTTSPGMTGIWVIALLDVENGQTFVDDLSIATCGPPANPSVETCPASLSQ